MRTIGWIVLLAGCGAAGPSSPATRDGVYACTFAVPDGGPNPWRCDIFSLDTGCEMAVFDGGSVAITTASGSYAATDVWTDAGTWAANVGRSSSYCYWSEQLTLRDRGGTLDFDYASDCRTCAGVPSGERVGSCVRK